MPTNPGFQVNVVQRFFPPASCSLGSFSVLAMLWEPNASLLPAALKCSDVFLYSERGCGIFVLLLHYTLYMVWLFVLLEIPKHVGCFTDDCCTETSSLNPALDDQGASGLKEGLYLSK